MKHTRFFLFKLFLSVLLIFSGCSPKQTAAEKAAEFSAEAKTQTNSKTLYTPSVATGSLGLADGSYTVSVTLSGGSGRANVISPAVLTMKEGLATARIVWSSRNYDYMILNNVKYNPVTLEGGSTFEIPVTGFDGEMPVIADTTTMSKPHEINYTLKFISASLKPIAKQTK